MFICIQSESISNFDRTVQRYLFLIYFQNDDEHKLEMKLTKKPSSF